MTATAHEEERETFTERCARLKRDTDLLALMEREGMHFRKEGARWRTVCPLHTNANGMSFTVFEAGKANLEGWRWKCHSTCGSGSTLDYVMKRYGLDVARAADWLDGGMRGGVVPRQSSTPKAARETTPVKLLSEDMLRTIAWEFATQLDYEIALPSGDAITGRDWWERGRGFSRETVDRFWLGSCLNCKTAWDKNDPERRNPSASIPIWQAGRLVAIRHRLYEPHTAGDKYRPHQRGQGLHLLFTEALAASEDVLVLEGESKVYALCDVDIENIAAPVSNTGGYQGWDNTDAEGNLYGEQWAAQLTHAKRIFMLYDNELKARERVQISGRRWFGRRAYPVYLPGKVDDMIRANEEIGLRRLMEALGAAQPVR